MKELVYWPLGLILATGLFFSVYYLVRARSISKAIDALLVQKGTPKGKELYELGLYLMKTRGEAVCINNLNTEFDPSPAEPFSVKSSGPKFTSKRSSLLKPDRYFTFGGGPAGSQTIIVEATDSSPVSSCHIYSKVK